MLLGSMIQDLLAALGCFFSTAVLMVVAMALLAVRYHPTVARLFKGDGKEKGDVPADLG